MFLLLCCRPARHTLCAAVRRAYVFFLVFANSLSENILDSDVVCKAMQIGKVALTFVVQGCPPPVRGTEPVVSGVRSGSRTLSLSFRLCAHLHDAIGVRCMNRRIFEYRRANMIYELRHSSSSAAFSRSIRDRRGAHFV
jgi:hypothetical protein